jgi:putative ABC transport system permease protein
VPLVAGRDFDDRDSRAAARVAIVNQTFARKYMGTANPVGRTFGIPAGPREPMPTFEVIGMAGDAKYGDLREEFFPEAYFPTSQNADPDSYVPVVIHSSVSPGALIPALKRTLGEINPQVGYEFHIFRDEVRQTLQREQMMATLSGFFGLLAALLATIGLYGVMSYMVARRRNEIGIRLALGAARGAVIRMVLREALVLLVLGLAAGSVLALAAAQTAGSLLFGLKPRDPATFVFSIVLLAAVAALASLLPARRAANLDPTVALREE